VARGKSKSARSAVVRTGGVAPSDVSVTPFSHTSAYACSKVALIWLTDSLQEDTAQHGVMLFATGPGQVRVSMVDRMENSGAARRWIPRCFPITPITPCTSRLLKLSLPARLEDGVVTVVEG
jgi:NAD(P)-dependent dehydrogenase (short-subunit alcohol dehydrogenase family)